MCRPLDGAIGLCYQGHKTKLVPSEGEGISLLTLLQIFFDHCVTFIFNNEIFLQSRLPFDLFKLVDVTAECATMGR